MTSDKGNVTTENPLRRVLRSCLRAKEMLSFKEWTMARLDQTFGLRQVRDCSCLRDWLEYPAKISDLERQMVEDKKSDLIKIFKSCNFEEAEEKLFGI